jgi:asparagine synthase (glutamine-hydrolysing)
MASVVRGFDEALASEDLDRMLAADIATRFPEHSLMLTDRMTMAQSLEARPPLLDHLLAEKVAVLPTDLKLHGRTLKYLLRKVSASYLPKPILERPKQGFAVPLASWMRGELAPLVREYLSPRRIREAGILDPSMVAGAVANFREGGPGNERLDTLLPRT